MVPNREADVDALCRQHPEAFPQDDRNDAARLVLLRGVIIPALNVEDRGYWGFLTKTDQRLPDGSYKVPCDVLVWRPTRETVDCLTGTGACWIVRPAPPPAWEWTAVEDPVVPDPDEDPVEDPVEPDPPSEASVPVFYAAATPLRGTIVPQPGGRVVLINLAGEVASMQPDGRLEWRPPGTVGAWELATLVGTVLVFTGGRADVRRLLVAVR
ncbi:MAG: hypothetical protein ABJA98_01785 [Acidobacteriota bacterium]